MRCENTITYYVPRGYAFREVEVTCGTTDPHGNRAQCEECLNSRAAREENARILANSEADNAWMRSAGWGEI